jgi:uncharacterized protein
VNRDGGSLVKDVLLGLVVGLFSGLFGVGGGVILVPLLVLLVRTEQKQAQATSLVVVALGASSGALTYGLAGSVFWLSVPYLIVAGLLGSWLGTIAVKKLRSGWLQILFGILLLAAAVRLGLESFVTGTGFVDELTAGVVLGFAASGLAVGFLSALLGVGGGIILIPLLVALFGFPQQLAAGTSLVAIIPLALFGALQLTRSGFTQWVRGFRIGVGSVPGAIAGAALALIIEAGVLQIGFAALLVFVAVSMFMKALK